ncbi:MAG: hypothetical protein DYG83_12615 [Candidatus Brocadia sp. AMX2]|uniref:Xylose isomerase-like TIM barrel domain-containing protein n=1 Tax=Candidatus Brocadia sinica JPN1 TaxID=1197129 RepID=A0ABQ0JTN7_9BACT|nr:MULTISPECIES: hypothetical protein [Brocadia]MBC6933390.1 hypothetical protein [Candidatus Brocadia sp.]NOG40019.1 hypothetical protein [Planctomycetota bacterium]GIK12909.1 MAG: hypothetical protein BroJett002_16160 [Candidatus Brocadia sinica]KAA0244374.1 MAG: hypothetical protein EDM70_06775 [Candidatus Brocadia sp. AMX2]MCE7867640.1 hypothetical protein [Candidatus Brocadia sp. AMX2]
MTIKIELSTMCFYHGDVLAKIKRCRNLIESHGYEFALQLHNSITNDLYNKIKGLDAMFTMHAPILSDHFINLANDDFPTILASFQNTASVMQSLQSTVALFHGFFMTQKPIKNDPANYSKVLSDAIDNKYRLKDTRVMDPAFLKTEEYRNYQNTVKKNMRLLRERYPSYTLCVENDFPGIGNGNQTPAHLIYLDCPIWLDIGHLWASAILNKFDFYAGLDAVCKQCQVIGVHINTNRTPLNWNLKYPDGDTHSHLSQGYDMDMNKIISLLKKNRVTHYTIEVIDGDVEDIHFFIETYHSVNQ